MAARVCVYLRAQLVVEQLEGGHPVVQILGLLRLLLLDYLSPRFDHRLHLPFHFAQHLIQLLKHTQWVGGRRVRGRLNTGSGQLIGRNVTHHALVQLRLHHVLLHAPDVQHPHLALDSGQQALALGQAGVKVGRLLEEPELGPHVGQHFLWE